MGQFHSAAAVVVVEVVVVNANAMMMMTVEGNDTVPGRVTT